MGSSNSHEHLISSKTRVLLKCRMYLEQWEPKDNLNISTEGEKLKKSGTSARYVQAYAIETT